jgi:hypothetical protein
MGVDLVRRFDSGGSADVVFSGVESFPPMFQFDRLPLE